MRHSVLESRRNRKASPICPSGLISWRQIKQKEVNFGVSTLSVHSVTVNLPFCENFWW